MRLFSYHGKHEKNKKMCLPLSAYLSYLLVATLMFTGVSFSKFATTASGSDSARVAEFNVTAAMADAQTSQTIDLTSATTAQGVSWSFTVTNNSEVAATDTVNIVLAKALPTGVSMSMKLGETNVDLTGPVTASDSSVTYTCAADIGFDVVHTWTLTFVGDPTVVTAEDTLNITINVDVEQKD